MKTIALGKSGVTAPQIGLGCMRMAKLETASAERLIRTALENGVNFFDHADIYGGGECETAFAKAYPMNSDRREGVILQTKCGIREGCFDFSKEHILESVDGSLSRLRTDYVDFLLLHRPDALMEPEEVAEAFRILKESGKVRHFGVSNQTPGQMALLEKYCGEPIAVNQLQFSVAHCPMIDAGLNANMYLPESVDRDGGVLEYCRLHDITIQAWSPLQYGMIQGNFLNNGEFLLLNEKLEYMSTKKGIPPAAVAIAWILRHPAKIQAIVGTTSKEHLQDIARAATVTLSREEWYELYCAAGNCLP